MKNPLMYSGLPGSRVVVLLLAILLPFFFLFNSCKKKPEPEPDCSPLQGAGLIVVDRTERDAQDVMDQLMLQPDDEGLFDYHDFYFEASNTMPGSVLPHPIAHEVVKYQSTDNYGNTIELSGLLIYPWSPLGRVKAPIVSVNHGTQLLKKLAPSQWKKVSWGDWKDFPEMLIADIMAVWYGWIIIMPDYQGMGEDVGENHPYVIRDRLATSTADMMQAAMASLSCNRHSYVSWNGQAFLYGFSEGGYVTMAAARELESREVSLNGVVCLDGPYDLSGTMLNVMLADKPFPVPYFLPMMLVGYNTMYEADFGFDAMLKPPYNTDIPKYTTGFYNDSVVNSKMPPDKILRKVFTNSFFDSLKSPSSKAYRLVDENNAFSGWTPKSKMLLWHCKNDDCVPFGNFVAAKNRFTGLGLTNIDYVEWDSVPLNPDRGTIHVTVAPRAFYEGSRWIYHHTK
jgi:pimeloyl-ACP methyl ester carboxylesterase